jgi:hypothetical protein
VVTTVSTLLFSSGIASADPSISSTEFELPTIDGAAQFEARLSLL